MGIRNLPHRKCDRKELDLYEEELVTGLPGFLDYQLLDLPGLLLTSRLLCIFRLLHMNLDLAVLTKELNQNGTKSNAHTNNNSVNILLMTNAVKAFS